MTDDVDESDSGVCKLCETVTRRLYRRFGRPMFLCDEHADGYDTVEIGADGEPLTPSVQARAREDEWEHEEAFGLYLAGIERGLTERTAAKATGLGYSTIRSWYEDHKTSPLHRARFERVLDARETEVQRRLDENDELPMSIGSGSTDEDAASSGIHPKSAELKMKHNVWRLEGLDPERFVPARKQKTEVSGPDGAPVAATLRIDIATAEELAKDDEKP